jgi:hypothetical protein
LIYLWVKNTLKNNYNHTFKPAQMYLSTAGLFWAARKKSFATFCFLSNLFMVFFSASFGCLLSFFFFFFLWKHFVSSLIWACLRRYFRCYIIFLYKLQSCYLSIIQLFNFSSGISVHIMAYKLLFLVGSPTLVYLIFLL